MKTLNEERVLTKFKTDKAIDNKIKNIIENHNKKNETHKIRNGPIVFNNTMVAHDSVAVTQSIAAAVAVLKQSAAVVGID